MKTRPASPSPSSDTADLAAASAAFVLLDRLEGASRRKHPSLVTVFRLYCMQNLTVYQIARQCRCSLGTVSHRLKLIRRQTGLSPKAFRTVWPPLKLEHLNPDETLEIQRFYAAPLLQS